MKDITRRRFLVGSSIVGGTAVIGGNVAANHFSSFLEQYVGHKPVEKTAASGTSGWDTNYYDKSYSTKDAARAAGEDLVTTIMDEGAVLLKNDGTLPLDTATTVSLLGRYSADPVYGGSGSGTVDASSAVNFKKGLENAGFTINDTAYDFINKNYSNYPKANIVMDSPTTSCYYIGEIPWDKYDADSQSSIAGTNAVIVLGRGGGEGGDLSRDLLGDLNSGASSKFTANDETANYVEGQHELELCKEEKDLIAAAKEACDSVTVVLNCSTTMELGPLMSGDYEVNAILDCGSIGSTGANGVGKILSGATNPSGKTTDLWAADFTADPTFQNFGSFQYIDVSGYYTQNCDTAYFVEYKEGLYSGYRYYETAAVEAKAGNYAGFDYDSAVVFPFGYGLSYSTFGERLDSVTFDGTDVTASVTVTNTGSVAGKQVVELYYSAPYVSGGLEKSAVNLGAFAKTDELEPGASQTVELSFPVRMMASWDSGRGCYVQDAGTYSISLRTDSHTVVASQDLALTAATYATDSATNNKLTNLFDDCTDHMKSYCRNLSRADFAGTWPDAAQDEPASSVGLTLEEFDPEGAADSSATMPTTGASNDVELIDLRGRDYDDDKWNDLLDELSLEDMIADINDDAYNTAMLTSISKPATVDPDGPQGFTSLMGNTGNCSYCSEYVMAQTWNVDVMHDMGNAIGEEALVSGYSGWYAPAMDTHRSPFAGRNFEYYSQDPVLGGRLGSAVITGAAEKGVYSFVKHFALNDQETNRVNHVCTWATEQTMREVYLRPFEITVKDSTYEEKYISDDNGTVSTKKMPACSAIMSSFNYVGGTWAGGSKALCTDLLRTEWGFTGVVISDFNLYDYMNKNQGIYAGTDIFITYSQMTGAIPDTTSASAVTSMRQAMHDLLYTVANSNAMQGMAPGTKLSYGLANWQYWLYGGSAVIAAALAAGWVHNARKVKKNPDGTLDKETRKKMEAEKKAAKEEKKSHKD